MRRLDLGARTIALLESRRAGELADLVRRYGGIPWSVPAMKEAPLDDRSESVQRLRQLCEEGTGVIICLTGVGTRALFELAAELDLEKRLREVFASGLVVIRGPKPRAVLRELGIRVDREAAEPNTSKEVLAALEHDQFERVAVQLYGEPDRLLRMGLEARGARVLELPLYRWALPDDLSGLLDLIDNMGRAAGLVITSASQVRNLFAVAERHDRAQVLDAALAQVQLAVVGPVAARALEERGFHAPVQPQHPSMGALVRDLAAFLTQAS